MTGISPDDPWTPVEPRPFAKSRPLAAVSRQMIAAAAAGHQRVHREAAHVRHHFVQRPHHGQRPKEGRPPPLATLLTGTTSRAGRGGEVRLKVYLSLLWLAVAGEHDVSFAASFYAHLLDLPDPYGNGARRVNTAFAWLAAHQFVRLDPRRGVESKVTLLSDGGTGRRYRSPGAPPGVKKEHPREDLYFKLPHQFWTNGWIAALSGPATAVLLVVRMLNNKEPTWSFVAPSRLTSHYALSEDTWSRGLAQLREAQLIEVRRRRVSSDFSWRRVRIEFRELPTALYTHPPTLTPAE